MKYAPLFLALLLAFPAHAEEAFRRSITVSAEAEAEATPDRAVLPITVEARDKSLTTAKKQNDERMEKFLKVATQFNLPKEKIKTSGFMIAPQYRWEQKTNKQVFETYLVSRTLELTIDQLEQVEKLIAALTEAGVDQMQNLYFTLARPDALESQARKEAMAKARAKAQELTEAAGAKLGKVLTISVSGSGYAPPMPMRAMAMKAEAMQDSAPPVLPGEVKIQQSVNVTYELE